MLRLCYKLKDSAYQPPLKLPNPAPRSYPLQYIILSTLSAHSLQKNKAPKPDWKYHISRKPFKA